MIDIDYQNRLYIDMCKKAKKIQKMWKPSYGDYYKKGIYNNTYVYLLDNLYDFENLATRVKDECIWLPQQNQLQKIYNYKCKLNAGQISMFFEDWRYEEFIRTHGEIIDWSMEQLYLGFVMKARYDKMWENNNWIKYKPRYV